MVLVEVHLSMHFPAFLGAPKRRRLHLFVVVHVFLCFLRSTNYKVDFNLNVADKLTLNVYTSLIIIT
jgi:hypothetical protein